MRQPHKTRYSTKKKKGALRGPRLGYEHSFTTSGRARSEKGEERRTLAQDDKNKKIQHPRGEKKRKTHDLVSIAGKRAGSPDLVRQQKGKGGEENMRTAKRREHPRLRKIEGGRKAPLRVGGRRPSSARLPKAEEKRERELDWREKSFSIGREEKRGARALVSQEIINRTFISKGEEGRAEGASPARCRGVLVSHENCLPSLAHWGGGGGGGGGEAGGGGRWGLIFGGGGGNFGLPSGEKRGTQFLSRWKRKKGFPRWGRVRLFFHLCSASGEKKVKRRGKHVLLPPAA